MLRYWEADSVQGRLGESGFCREKLPDTAAAFAIERSLSPLERGGRPVSDPGCHWLEPLARARSFCVSWYGRDSSEDGQSLQIT